MAPLSLQSDLGLAEHEVVSPVNPDTAYLTIVVALSTLLFYSVHAADGDESAYAEMLGGAREIARIARIIRVAGKPQPSVPPGAHELLAPFILVVRRINLSPALFAHSAGPCFLVTR